MEVISNIIDLTESPQTVTRRKTITCGFCRQKGHNINTCSSNELRDSYERLKTIYAQEMDQPSQNNMQSIFDNFNRRTLQVIGKRYFRIPLKTEYENLCDKILLNLSNNYLLMSQNTGNIRRRPVQTYNIGSIMREYMSALLTENELELMTSILVSKPVSKNEAPIINLKLNETEIKDNEILTCCVCMDDTITTINSIKTNCGHEFCNNCMKNWVKKTGEGCSCPVCRTELNEITINLKENFEDWKSIVREN